ncbi:MAG: hypothetical protein GY737_15545 [Desulfobacteraceae bacterium]|nr:hypothetical protein [Desulfobacteraceae bacterium]
MGLSVNSSASALKALGTKMAVSANNVANVNSDDFKKSRALVTEGDNGGVKVDISKVATEGPLVTETFNNEKVQRELSNTDIAEEFTQQIFTQYGFEANTKTIRTQDEMLGTVIDIIA